MTDTSPDSPKRPIVTRTGLLVGLIALTFPFLADAIIFGGSGQAEKMFDAPAALLGNAIYAALFFWLLDSAMRPRRRVRIALWVGLGLTACVWLGFALTGRAYQMDGSSGNAHLGLFMLLMAWPLINVVIMGLVAKVGEPEEPHHVT